MLEVESFTTTIPETSTENENEAIEYKRNNYPYNVCSTSSSSSSSSSALLPQEKKTTDFVFKDFMHPDRIARMHSSPSYTDTNIEKTPLNTKKKQISQTKNTINHSLSIKRTPARVTYAPEPNQIQKKNQLKKRKKSLLSGSSETVWRTVRCTTCRLLAENNEKKEPNTRCKCRRILIHTSN